MKITLQEEDIKKLLTDNYNGINEMKFPKEFEIVLEVNIEEFLSKRIRTGKIVRPTPPTTPSPPVSQDTLNNTEASDGRMASGGSRRTLRKIG